MPASQLTQLKNSLSAAGLNRRSNSKNDKKAFKKGGVKEVDRQKTLSRLEDIRKGLNKFDERETRVRYCGDEADLSVKARCGRTESERRYGKAQCQQASRS